MRFYLFFYLIFIVCSCSPSKDENKNINEIRGSENKKADKIIQYNYKENTEIEALIAKQPHRFLSYFWYGMSENECLEVLRYVMDQGKVEAFLIKGYDEEPIFSNNIKRIKVKNQSVGYSNPSESSRIMYSIQGKKSSIKFELKFDFGLEHDSLRSVTLSATPIYNSSENIVLTNYNYLMDIFSLKYGRIVDKTTQEWELLSKHMGKTDEYKRCRYLKNGVSVELEYSCGKNSSDGNLLPHLTIYYQLHLDEKFSTYESSRKSYEKFEKENDRKKREILLEDI